MSDLAWWERTRWLDGKQQLLAGRVALTVGHIRAVLGRVHRRWPPPPS